MTADALAAWGLALLSTVVGLSLAAYYKSRQDRQQRARAAIQRQINRDRAWAIMEAKMVARMDTVVSEVGGISARIDKMETRLDRLVYSGPSNNGNGAAGEAYDRA